MTHPEQIVALAHAASQFEERPADAAALLVDAAAFLATEASMSTSELSERLASTRKLFLKTAAKLKH